MKRFLTILALFASLAKPSAQQLNTSSLYELQGLFHNPATAGTYAPAIVGGVYRTQWSSFTGAPRTATVFGSFDLPEQKIGLGGYLYSDKTGPTSRTGIALAFSKHIPLNNGAKFSAGLEARGLQYAIDRAKLTQTLGADPAIAGGDNSFKFDAGAGVAYTSKRLQLGVSVSQIIQSKLNFYEGTLTPAEEARLYRHYYLHGSYKWDVDQQTTITPSFCVIYLPNAPTDFQGGIRVEHNQLFWWGLAARARQSFILSAGVHIKNAFSLGYSFDIYKTPLSVFDAGANAHELMLRYSLTTKAK
jgi:type IX secretion system PorP/SprF family membrane protein